MLCSLDSPVFLLHTLATVASPAPYLILIISAWLALPQSVLLAHCWVVGENFFAKYWSLFFHLHVITPVRHFYAAVSLLPATFKARIFFPQILMSAAFELFNVNLLLVICCFLEGVLVSPIQAVEDPPILCFCFIDALARNPIFPIVFLLFVASEGGKAPGEVDPLLKTLNISRAGFILPLISPAPGQFSLTAGVTSADGWFVRDFFVPSSVGVFSMPVSCPLPLLHTDTGVGTGCYIGSAGIDVSVFVLRTFIALSITTLI